GDYDMRLRSYCSMFVEHFDETVLYNEFRKNDEEFRLRQLSEVHEVAVTWPPQAPALLPDRIEIWASMGVHGSASNDWGRFAGITVGSGRSGLLLTGLATTKTLRMLLWKDSQQPVGLQCVTILGFPLPTHLNSRRGARTREDRVEKEKRTEELVERTGTQEPPRDEDEDISLDKVAREVSSAMIEVRRSLEDLPELPDIRPVGTLRMHKPNQECENDPMEAPAGVEDSRLEEALRQCSILGSEVTVLKQQRDCALQALGRLREERRGRLDSSAELDKSNDEQGQGILANTDFLTGSPPEGSLKRYFITTDATTPFEDNDVLRSKTNPTEVDPDSNQEKQQSKDEHETQHVEQPVQDSNADERRPSTEVNSSDDFDALIEGLELRNADRRMASSRYEGFLRRNLPSPS
ncbi:hypothetical protein FOZ62_028386, partial [Perkinsus olseni]